MASIQFKVNDNNLYVSNLTNFNNMVVTDYNTIQNFFTSRSIKTAVRMVFNDNVSANNVRTWDKEFENAVKVNYTIVDNTVKPIVVFRTEINNKPEYVFLMNIDGLCTRVWIETGDIIYTSYKEADANLKCSQHNDTVKEKEYVKEPQANDEQGVEPMNNINISYTVTSDGKTVTMNRNDDVYTINGQQVSAELFNQIESDIAHDDINNITSIYDYINNMLDAYNGNKSNAVDELKKRKDALLAELDDIDKQLNS